jgi:hypothetical protein
MKKTLIIGAIAVVAIIGLFVLFVGIGAVSFYNKEVRLSNTISTKQEDNKNQMDAMWKIIDQNAQVAQEDRDTLTKLFTEYAAGRSNDKAVFNWVKEAVPNVSVNSDNFKVLMNTITAQRDGFKFRQTELLDFGREHDNLIREFPNNIYAHIFGCKHIDVVIVTSTRTDNAFKTGQDNDTKLFNNR